MGGPWEDYAAPGTTSGPWDDYAKADASLAATKPVKSLAPSGFNLETAADVGKSAGAGLVKGVAGLPGIPGDLMDLGGMGVDWAVNRLASPETLSRYNKAKESAWRPPLPTSADTIHALEKVTGPLYEPKTRAGQYAQTIGEFAPNLIGGPEAIATKLATRVAAPALASETAGQLAEGSAYEPLARIAGAIAGHGAGAGVSRSLAPSVNVPTTGELFEAANNGYKSARGYGVEIDPKPVAKLADNIISELGNDGFRQINVPRTWSAIEELRNPWGRNVTIDDIDSVRKVLNKAGDTVDKGEREASRRAIAAIDDYVANLDPSHVVNNPHFAADVSQELKEARGNWAAARRSELVNEREGNANWNAGSAGSGANIDNATRQQFKAILKNPKLRRGFSAEELEQMERVVMGSTAGNALRAAGKFAPTGIVPHALSMGLGHTLAGPAGAVGVPAAGYALKKLADASTAHQVRNLDEMVRLRSPLGQSLPQPAPPAPVSLRQLGVSGAIGGEQRASGGSVTKITDHLPKALMHRRRAEGGGLSDADIESMTHHEPDVADRYAYAPNKSLARVTDALPGAIYNTLVGTPARAAKSVVDAVYSGQNPEGGDLLSAASLGMTARMPFAKPGTIGVGGGRMVQPAHGTTHFDADANVDPTRIEPFNKVEKVKVNKIADSMRESGWIGRPLLAYEGSNGLQAVTGSHRIAAARKADVDVPVMLLDDEAFTFRDKNGKTFDELYDDNDKARFLSQLSSVDEKYRKASELMSEEVKLNGQSVPHADNLLGAGIKELEFQKAYNALDAGKSKIPLTDLSEIVSDYHNRPTGATHQYTFKNKADAMDALRRKFLSRAQQENGGNDIAAGFGSRRCGGRITDHLPKALMRGPQGRRAAV